MDKLRFWLHVLRAPFRQNEMPTYLVMLSIATAMMTGYYHFLAGSPLAIAAAAVLVCLGPGLMLVDALFPAPGSLQPLERLALGMGASYSISILAILGYHYVLGALHPLIIPALCMLLAVLFRGIYERRRGWGFWSAGAEETRPVIITDAAAIPGRNGSSSRRSVFPTPYEETALPLKQRLADFLRSRPAIFLALLLVAAVLRFASVNYADFKGDEADVLLGSVAMIYGEGQPIFQHTKGPGEMIVPALFGLFCNGFDEFTSRLPFTIAGMVGVAGVYLLGRRMFDETTALVALALAAIDGLFLHYARTAQYQSLVFMSIVLAVYCYYRYYQEGRGAFHLLGTLLLSAGALTHYETAMVVPVALYLTGKRLWDNRPVGRREWAIPATSALLFVVALASFYVPFALHPHLDSTTGYLSRRVGQEFLYNNFDEFYVNALTYNSFYYVALLFSLLAVALLRQTAKISRLELGILLVAVVLGQGFALAQGTAQARAASLLLVYLVLLALWLRSQAVGVVFKALLCWLALPFLAYMFLVERPGSHYYIYTAAFVLLAAWVISDLLGRLSRHRRGLIAGGVGLAALYAILVYYPYLLYLRNDYEYMLTYPEHKSGLYPTDPRFPFGQRIGFGFPYRLGWQMVGHLYRTGVLEGDWDSDDKGNSLTWYTLGIPRNPCYPRYYFLADVKYKEEGLEVPQKLIDEQYVLKAQVWDNGRVRLRIYEHAPDRPQVEPLNLVEPASYDSYVKTEMFHTVPYAERLRLIPNPLDVNLEGKVRLAGYSLDESRARPGGSLGVTLYWQAVAAMDRSYKVFTHLESEQLWSQADDLPVCHTHPTNEWKPGEYVVDRHVMALPTDLPPGLYPLRVGMYDAETGQRLALSEKPENDFILREVEIKQP